MVVGASVGSLNGCLIARGCSGDDLVRRWLELDKVAEVRWRIPRHLSDGIVDSAHLHALIRDLCQAGPPKLQFGVVATEFPKLKPRLFRGDEIEWETIAASCAVPLFLAHFRINGVYYSDGGLVRSASGLGGAGNGRYADCGSECFEASTSAAGSIPWSRSSL